MKHMKNMKHIFGILLAALTFATLAISCGGGGGLPKADYPKIPTHPIYGDLPQLEAKWDALENALKEMKSAEQAKVKNAKQMENFVARFTRLEEEAEAQKQKEYAAALAKVNPVPFEVRDGVGYTVRSVTVSSPNGWDIDLEVTDRSKINVSMIGVGTGRMNFIDASGNVIREDVEFYGLGGMNNGDSKVINLGFSNYDVSKIVFTR